MDKPPSRAAVVFDTAATWRLFRLHGELLKIFSQEKPLALCRWLFLLCEE